MAHYKNILVPIDFSANSKNALRYAIQFAAITKSKLIVFNVNHLPALFPSAELKEIQNQSDERKKRMLEYTLEKVCKAASLTIPQKVSYIISRDKDIAKSILSSAKNTNTDLIIMGTHGETGLKKVLFGSNTAAVIDKSAIPVLAIPPRYQFKSIENIVYASGLKKLKEELDTIIPLAKTFGANIQVLNIDYWDKELDYNTQSKINDILKKTSYKKINFIHKDVTIKDTLAGHLQKYTQKQNAPILAMFPEKQNFFEKLLLGSITKSVASHIKQPLLSIKKV